MSRHHRSPHAVVLVFFAILSGTSAAHAACATVDHTHAAWTSIVARWVHKGRVDYAGLKSDGNAALDAYLSTLSGTCAKDYETWSTPERIAFWLNVYNAFSVRQILDHYPITSVRKIGWLPGAAFRNSFIPMPNLKGGSISLDDIEHATLRRDFQEPRIHFALVCAARSCPPLRSEAYRADNLDRQLDDQGRTFLRDTAKNRFDAAQHRLYLSSIFKWFRGDFEAAAGSLPAFVAGYLEDPRAAASGVEIEFLDYDWALND